MRQKVVAGNWKMNTSFQEGIALAQEVKSKSSSVSNDVQIILCAPFTHLSSLVSEVKGSSIAVAAQNCNDHESGAYTGEVSASMLSSIGVDYVVLGHSERREYFGESNEMLATKIDQVLNNDLKPIFCCGETLEQREDGIHFDFVKKQIEDSLFHLAPEDFEKVVIAYEPIWAIGTGVTASSAQAQEMHAFIRRCIEDKYGVQTAEKASLLYGGSMKPANAKELLACNDVEGGLIGGASLKSDDFIAIANSY